MSDMGLTPYVGEGEPRYETPLEVRRALEGLALALNYSLTPEQGRVYAFTLRDLEPRWLRAACVALARSERFWPKPVDIREKALELMRAHRDQQAARLQAAPDREPTFRCYRCLDAAGGWLQPMRCPSERSCGRTSPHPPHTFTARCPCWLERNAALLEQRRSAVLQSNAPMPFDVRALDELREGCYEWAKPY